MWLSGDKLFSSGSWHVIPAYTMSGLSHVTVLSMPITWLRDYVPKMHVDFKFKHLTYFDSEHMSLLMQWWALQPSSPNKFWWGRKHASLGSPHHLALHVAMRSGQQFSSLEFVQDGSHWAQAKVRSVPVWYQGEIKQQRSQYLTVATAKWCPVLRKQLISCIVYIYKPYNLLSM